MASAWRNIAYTTNIPNKTGTSDGTFSDTTNLVTTVISRHENGWVLTFGALNTTNTWDASLTDVCKIFTTNSLTFGGPPTTGTNYWVLHLNGSVAAFSAANATGEFSGAVNGENTIRGRYMTFETTSTQTGGGPILHRRGIGRRCFRYDHLIFRGDWHDAVIFTGNGANPQGGAGPYGLINICRQGGNTQNAEGMKLGMPNDSHNYDTVPQTYGTEYTVAVEDCTWVHNGATSVGTPWVDTSLDVRILVRHNTTTNYTIVTHGKDSDAHAGQQYEILHNAFHFTETASGQNAYNLFFRGGNGYIWDNDFYNAGHPNCFFFMANYCSCTNSPYFAGCTNYPASEQIGQGVTAGPTISTVGTYFFDNRNAGISPLQTFIVGLCAQDASMILDGRDYFSSTPKPGYSELAYPHPLIALTTASDESGGGVTATNPPIVITGTALLRGGVKLRAVH